VHSIYVFSLPAGPIWALHSFYLTTSWLMLIWWLRYRPRLPGSTQTTLEEWFTGSSTTAPATTSTYCGTGSRDGLSQGDPSSGQGSRSWASRKVGDLDRMRYRRGW
jgi:hypothetical protein